MSKSNEVKQKTGEKDRLLSSSSSASSSSSICTGFSVPLLDAIAARFLHIFLLVSPPLLFLPSSCLLLRRRSRARKGHSRTLREREREIETAIFSCFVFSVFIFLSFLLSVSACAYFLSLPPATFSNRKARK